MRARDVRRGLALGVAGAILGLFLLLPLGEGVRGTFVDPSGRFTLAYVTGVFRNPLYVEGLRNALAIALGSTALAGAIGLGMAFLLDRFDFPGRRVLGALVPLPLMVPPFVGAIGIKQLLGQSGAFNALLIRAGLMDASRPLDWLREGRFAAVVGLTALHLYPIVYLNVRAALGGVNVEMEEAAASLGCRGLRLFRKVTLPAILPSVFAATSIVLIAGFTELGVPLICDYDRVTSMQIFAGIKELGRNPFVYALVFVIVNLVVDVSYAFLDPRIRLS